MKKGLEKSHLMKPYRLEIHMIVFQWQILNILLRIRYPGYMVGFVFEFRIHIGQSMRSMLRILPIES